jgi:hypothetical protein
LLEDDFGVARSAISRVRDGPVRPVPKRERDCYGYADDEHPRQKS